jgi:hypothetical protein
MAKDAFNSVSGHQNKAPEIPSGFMKDKRGRLIKTEEDFATATIRLADGRHARFRAGKQVSADPLPMKR